MPFPNRFMVALLNADVQQLHPTDSLSGSEQFFATFQEACKAAQGKEGWRYTGVVAAPVKERVYFVQIADTLYQSGTTFIRLSDDFSVLVYGPNGVRLSFSKKHATERVSGFHALMALLETSEGWGFVPGKGVQVLPVRSVTIKDYRGVLAEFRGLDDKHSR